MARAERRDGLMLWGAMGLGVGLLAGFVLAEVVGGRAAVDSGRTREEAILGDQEGAPPVEDDRGYTDRGYTDRGHTDRGYGDLTLADQSA